MHSIRLSEPCRVIHHLTKYASCSLLGKDVHYVHIHDLDEAGEEGERFDNSVFGVDECVSLWIRQGISLYAFRK